MKSVKSKALTLVMAIVVLLAIALMVRLGFWQLHRAEEKQQQLDYFEQQAQGPQLTLEEILQLSKIQGQRVAFQGELMPEMRLYWDNRVVNGEVGYEVIVPVKTNFGIVLTNWGWVKGRAYRDQLPEVSLPTNATQFQGVIWQPERNRFVSSALSKNAVEGRWPKVVQAVEPASVQALFGTALLPFNVALNQPRNPALINNVKPVVMPPEKHIAYAIQWFGLAAACAVVAAVCVKKVV